MLEQKQLYMHRPADGVIGDCFRTCIACVLDLPPDAVPHVWQQHWESEDSTLPRAELNAWLAPRGLAFVEYPLECTSVELRTYLAHYFRGVHVVLGCNSKHGGHSVVARDADYLWDPSIDNSGCVGPMKDGYYWVGLLVHGGGTSDPPLAEEYALAYADAQLAAAVHIWASIQRHEGDPCWQYVARDQWALNGEARR